MSEHQIRRCIVCGRREKKGTLARFVKQGERVLFDEAQTEEGRGVYVHPTPECFSRLTEGRFWDRALSRKGAARVARESVLGAIDDARAVLKLSFVI